MSETLNIGALAPDFTAKTDGDGEVTLSNLQGKNIVLFFYPKDNTPGCTKESIGFNDNLEEFNKYNTQIIGISKDSVKKHDKFKEKYGFNFPLLSDEDLIINNLYNVWVEKKLYGKSYMGTERSTFLIDEKGKIQHIWRKVKVKNHIEDVLETVKNLYNSNS